MTMAVLLWQSEISVVQFSVIPRIVFPTLCLPVSLCGFNSLVEIGKVILVSLNERA